MDIDILFWLIIAALPIISGLRERRRKQQLGARTDPDDTATTLKDGRDPELGSALEEIRRALAGEYPEPEKPHWEEQRAPQQSRPVKEPRAQSRPATETRAKGGTARKIRAKGSTAKDVLPNSPLVKSPENLMHLPMPVATGKIEVEEALTERSSRRRVPVTPKQIRHAIILADVLGTPRFKNRHRPF